MPACIGIEAEALLAAVIAIPIKVPTFDGRSPSTLLRTPPRVTRPLSEPKLPPSKAADSGALLRAVGDVKSMAPPSVLAP